MTKARRQSLLLAILLAVLAVALWRSIPARRDSGGAGGSRRTAAAAAAASGVQVLELRLADLERETGEFRPGRDPFRYAEPERPAVPEPVAPSAAEIRARELLAAARAEAAEPAAPRPPAINVVYLGSFGPAERKIAVFSDEDTIYNASVGDVVSDKFILVQIGLESVDLKFVGFPDAPAQRLAVGG